MKKLFIILTLLGLFSFSAQAQINCTKSGHVGETGIKLEATNATRDGENILVSVTISHWVCIQDADQFKWIPDQALSTRQKTGYNGVTHTFKIKKSVAYLATQNYKYFKNISLTNASVQTLNYQFSAAEVAEDSKAGKLHFFLRTYGAVEFSDGRVIDPMVDSSRTFIVAINN